MTTEDNGQALNMDLWSRPGFLIRRLHQIHVAIFQEECHSFDITPVQYAVLSILYRQQELDQVSVAREVGIDRNNAADVIRRLERRGLVRRVPSPEDRRSRLAVITEAGKNFVEGAHDAMDRAQKRLTGELSRQETEQLMSLLQKIMTDRNLAGRAPRRLGETI